MESEISMLRTALSRAAAGGGQTAPDKGLDDLEAELQSAADRFLGGDESAEALLDEIHKQIMAHPETAVRKDEAAKKWEEDEREKNLRALDVMRSFVPGDICASSSTAVSEAILAALGEDHAAAAAKLAKRVWKTQALWLIRMPVERIRRSHIADFRTRWAVNGLDIVELRAVYAVLPLTFEQDGGGQKLAWRANIREKLMEPLHRASEPGARQSRDVKTSRLRCSLNRLTLA
jgi:hypothetical protein